MTLRSARTIRFLRLAALCIAVICILVGISRGEAAIVLRKAVRICLECIGVAG